MIANSVRVMAVISNASNTLNPLPAGYNANVQSGTEMVGSNWITLGTIRPDKFAAGHPQVAPFDLSSKLLPSPSNLPNQSRICLLAFIHSDQNPFTAMEQNVDSLSPRTKNS